MPEDSIQTLIENFLDFSDSPREPQTTRKRNRHKKPNTTKQMLKTILDKIEDLEHRLHSGSNGGCNPLQEGSTPSRRTTSPPPSKPPSIPIPTKNKELKGAITSSPMFLKIQQEMQEQGMEFKSYIKRPKTQDE